MRAFLPWLAFLMLLVTSLASVAHAAEAPGSGAMGIELAAHHAPGDADEVPPDCDSDVPHHHSICHGHDLAAPVKAPISQMFQALPPAIPLTASATLCARTTDTPHRPPIA